MYIDSTVQVQWTQSGSKLNRLVAPNQIQDLMDTTVTQINKEWMAGSQEEDEYSAGN